MHKVNKRNTVTHLRHYNKKHKNYIFERNLSCVNNEHALACSLWTLQWKWGNGEVTPTSWKALGPLAGPRRLSSQLRQQVAAHAHYSRLLWLWGTFATLVLLPCFLQLHIDSLGFRGKVAAPSSSCRTWLLLQCHWRCSKCICCSSGMSCIMNWHLMLHEARHIAA